MSINRKEEKDFEGLSWTVNKLKKKSALTSQTRKKTKIKIRYKSVIKCHQWRSGYQTKMIKSVY